MEVDSDKARTIGAGLVSASGAAGIVGAVRIYAAQPGDYYE